MRTDAAPADIPDSSCLLLQVIDQRLIPFADPEIRIRTVTEFDFLFRHPADIRFDSLPGERADLCLLFAPVAESAMVRTAAVGFQDRGKIGIRIFFKDRIKQPHFVWRGITGKIFRLGRRVDFDGSVLPKGDPGDAAPFRFTGNRG